MHPARNLHPLLMSSAEAAAGAPAAETARMLLATDWAATPLGPTDDWPQSLRIAVSICLNSRFPMFVWWGPRLVNIYNDAYIPVLGKRHPGAFGKPARDSWNDIWDVLGPQVEEVMVHGRATWNERVLLTMERNGFPEETYFTWSYSPIHDESGAIGGLFCACTEETGRVAAERERDRLVREAQDAARTLRAWFDHAPGFIALLRGPDFTFEMVNRAYYQLVGHRRLEGLPAFEALPEMREQGFQELLSHVYETGEAFVGRGMRLLVQSEPQAAVQERFVDFVYQPMRGHDGRVVGIFAQGHDVTEQVLGAQALQEADRRKDEFLATLAHELRNPLAPIRQAAQLAKSGTQSPERQRWALDVIERQVGHMSLLLDDLLDVSRISRGKLELRLQEVDLREVLDAAVETVRPMLDGKRHRLDVDAPEAAVLVRADPVRLAQVLSNLLSNAAKYTDPGGRIELHAAVQGRALELRVRDNGIGLSPQHQQEIFTMFSQVSSVIDRAEGGLGIGLALSRGLVEMHGGRIEAHSAGIGQGSEFRVRLPDSVLRAAGPRAGAAPEAAGGPGRKVLLADDNADALQTMAALLEIEGHEVLSATDGAQALELAARSRPDVAVIDIGMPRMNGYEVAAAIRAAPWGRGTCLIALTGWGQVQDQQRATEAGFDHHCTKPVELRRLLELIAGAEAAAGAK